MSNKWTIENMPDLTGKIVVVTGANSGLGFETASAFAQKGAQVILASRNVAKAKTAVAQIEKQAPNAVTEIIQLDLSNLASIHQFAAEFNGRHHKCDILVNNAGVMALPYQQTAAGFEMQFGVNHLGHFALTGLLLERLLAAGNGRVVTVSSSAHRSGKMDFGNLNGEKSYQRWSAYSQSKLANLLFAYECQRKLEEAGKKVLSVGTHPGYAATNLQHIEGERLQNWLLKLTNIFLSQSQAMGALPILYAATAPDVQGCDYIGPSGLMNMRGYPTKERSSKASYNTDAARKLWAISEELTNVSYELQTRGK